MMWATVVTSLLTTLVGGAITWVVSRWYYLRASKDLTAEASQLRQLTVLMLRGMKAAGWVRYNRDDQGNPVGIVFEPPTGGTVHLSGKATSAFVDASNEGADR